MVSARIFLLSSVVIVSLVLRGVGCDGPVANYNGHRITTSSRPAKISSFGSTTVNTSNSPTSSSVKSLPVGSRSENVQVTTKVVNGNSVRTGKSLTEPTISESKTKSNVIGVEENSRPPLSRVSSIKKAVKTSISSAWRGISNYIPLFRSRKQ